MKRLLIKSFIMGILVLMACEEPTEWEIDPGRNDLLVVEALITNEIKRHSIRLTKAVMSLNGSPTPATNATVAITDGRGVALFVENPPGSGLYWSDSLGGVVGQDYVLYINWNQTEYTASATMETLEPLTPLQYHPSGTEGFYEITYNDQGTAAMTEHWISWAHLPGYENLPQEETVARSIHYVLESIDVSEVFPPPKEAVRFPVGSYVLRRKYGLSDAHQQFLRTLLLETEWRGSIFDIAKGDVVTNMSEGAVGFFSMSAIVSDTTLIRALN
jgi:hypothetical protein